MANRLKPSLGTTIAADKVGRWVIEKLQERIDSAKAFLADSGYPDDTALDKEENANWFYRNLKDPIDIASYSTKRVPIRLAKYQTYTRDDPLSDTERTVLYAYNYLKQLELAREELLADDPVRAIGATDALLELIPRPDQPQSWEALAKLLASRKRGQQQGTRTRWFGYAIEKATRRIIEQDDFETLTEKSGRDCFAQLSKKKRRRIVLDFEDRSHTIRTRKFPISLLGRNITITAISGGRNPTEIAQQSGYANTLLTEKIGKDQLGQMNYETFRRNYYKRIWQQMHR